MKKNKGFSLVELIIVIAIMAILVGFMAPLLIKYIEKTRVSSDYQLADMVRTSVSIAITDARVVSDPASQPFLTKFEQPGGMNIDNDASFLSTNSVLRESLESAFGFPASNILTQIRSSHGSGCHINVRTEGSNTVIVTIMETDNEAKHDTSSNTPNNDISVQ